MIPALVISVLAVLASAVLRMGVASTLRTPRADALRDAAEGRRGAAAIAKLLEQRDALQPSITALTTTLLVAAAVPSSWVLARGSYGLGLMVSMMALVVGLVVVADLAPRAVGRARPRLAYLLAPLLVRAASIGAWANDLLPSDTLPAEEEDGSEAEEAEEERRLITSVIEFSDTIVREVMVPRTAMVTIKAVDSVDRLLALIEEHGFSRFPVAGPGEDIVGMVIAKDLLPAVARDKRPATVGEIMRPIDFVPETKRASDLLKEMQAKKIHMAVAIDEFGDVAGLVTLEDLLEELVGEIVDEYDEEEPMVRPVGEGVWLVDGRAGIDELSVAVNIELPDEDWDTVAGLVLGLAGRFPEVDENLELGDLRFKVLRLQGRRVADVEVQRVATVDAAVEDRR